MGYIFAPDCTTHVDTDDCAIRKYIFTNIIYGYSDKNLYLLQFCDKKIEIILSCALNNHTLNVSKYLTLFPTCKIKM